MQYQIDEKIAEIDNHLKKLVTEDEKLEYLAELKIAICVYHSRCKYGSAKWESLQGILEYILDEEGKLLEDKEK